MGLLSLIKKFVNEGEVVEEELTGDLAVDPIVSYESSANANHKLNVATQNVQTTQKTKATKSTEIESKPTARKVQRTIKTFENKENEDKENNELEL